LQRTVAKTSLFTSETNPYRWIWVIKERLLFDILKIWLPRIKVKKVSRYKKNNTPKGEKFFLGKKKIPLKLPAL
jgi:hypothetical protein